MIVITQEDIKKISEKLANDGVEVIKGEKIIGKRRPCESSEPLVIADAIARTKPSDVARTIAGPSAFFKGERIIFKEREQDRMVSGIVEYLDTSDRANSCIGIKYLANYPGVFDHDITIRFPLRDIKFILPTSEIFVGEPGTRNDNLRSWNFDNFPRNELLLENVGIPYHVIKGPYKNHFGLEKVFFVSDNSHIVPKRYVPIEAGMYITSNEWDLFRVMRVDMMDYINPVFVGIDEVGNIVMLTGVFMVDIKNAPEGTPTYSLINQTNGLLKEMEHKQVLDVLNDRLTKMSKFYGVKEFIPWENLDDVPYITPDDIAVLWSYHAYCGDIDGKENWFNHGKLCPVVRNNVISDLDN